MTELEDHESRVVVENGSGDRSGEVPLTARLLLREPLTARRAGVIIAAFTVPVTVTGGILKRVLDQKEYPNIGRGPWFALQRATTVGYGDVTPEQPSGRVIAGWSCLPGSASSR